MGREVKRVPLNFEWPINKIWHGYLIRTCVDEDCNGCQLFGKIKGYKINKNGLRCPEFPDLGPPKGKGWQMWENVTEGSAISPVFKTPEELAQWLYHTKASAFGDLTLTYEEWLSKIK